MGRFPSKARAACAVLVIVLGARVAYSFAGYVWNAGSQRFHVESAALIFVVCGIACRFVGRVDMEEGCSQDDRPGLIGWCLFCLAALAIYWPVLFIGLLSDDYVLVANASRWAIGPRTEILFRPVPLFVWAALLNLGAGSVGLHVLNLMLHGTNAYLAALVFHGWTRDRWASWLAGSLLLVGPLAPEAVAWCSGVFDLFAGAAVMLMILVARRYSGDVSAGTRLALIALGVAAVMSKETAAVGVALVVVDAWARRAITRTLALDALMLGAGVGIYGVLRLSSVATNSGTEFTRYALQRTVFGAFGNLAVPWHSEVIAYAAPVAYCVTLVLIASLARFFSRGMSTRSFRFAAGAAVWILVPVIPFWAWYFVAPDLQGARYLYLPSVGWSFLVILLFSDAAWPHRRWLLGVAALALASAYAFGTLCHLRPWLEAADMRDRVEACALQAGMRSCEAVVIGGLPDTVKGAYVFRNGAAEAFSRDLGIRATVGVGAGPCCFMWDSRLQMFGGCRVP